LKYVTETVKGISRRYALKGRPRNSGSLRKIA
jgi:hypothetical protein